MQENKLMLLDVTHASRRGTSLRISLPKKVSDKLGIKPEDIIGFYTDGERVIIKKVE